MALTDQAIRKEMAVTDLSLGYFFLRTIIGVNILIHGVSRLLSGTEPFASSLVQSFHSTPLPASLVAGFASALPWLEGAIGLLVLIGLFSRVALSAGALLILLLTFGTTLRQDWETAGLQLIYAVVYAALLALRGYDTLSADSLINSFKGKRTS